MAGKGPVGFGRREDGPSEAPTSDAPFPDGATKLDDAIAAGLLPERPARGHKGSFGKLLVIAGSLDYAGAALLVARAAGRAGAGLVTLAVPGSLQPMFAAKVVEATTMALPEDDVEELDPEPSFARILDHDHDAIVIGPGLRPGLATAELVRRLIVADDPHPAPILLDAEALRSLATMDDWWDGDRRPAVLTPHAGEFARLRAGSGRDPDADGDLAADDDARVAAVRDAAASWRQCVVLKGARTVIATPGGEVAIAPFENPALASGGTGDVLAGAIGSLLAQGLVPFDAARLGVYLHGLAGDAARERLGDAGVLASDLPDGLAIARKRLAAIAERKAAGKRLGVRGSLGRRAGLTAIEDRLAAAGLPALPRTAWLEIDLGAIGDNLRLLRGLAGPEVPVFPVVKADAYGHGAVPVAAALVRAGVDGLCVATLDEGLALRAGGVDSPIHVLYPIPAGGVGDAAVARLSVTVGDRASEESLLDAVGRLPPGLPLLAVQVEVETGLGRGGIDVAELGGALVRLREADGVVPSALWTHLQAPEDPELTAIQLARFDEASRVLAASGLAMPRHVSASAGVLTGIVPPYEGFRPGLAIYGLVPDELDPASAGARAGAGLRPALSLHARPVRVADLPTGWGISYGPAFRTARPSRIATLPFGYGDGWSRSLSDRAEALVRGRRVPIVGRVAMDVVMVDVTDVPGPPVDTTDAFVLIGRQGDEVITVGDVARLRNTNAWEVVTSMARRLPRVYHAESGPLGLRTLIG